VGVNGLFDCFLQAVGVHKGLAAGGFGHGLHGAMFVGRLLKELCLVLAKSARSPPVFCAGVTGAEHRRGHQTASVDGVNGDLASGEKIRGLAKLIFR
jgi:hypothetical protein